ncbi:hypothetical protein RHMOL_Rhmol05G0168200 [Rhododendron molle]|uniref:Uncharacterized protein n=3 Tax=Rhododendron molle TaxID=49168 RepID=A0ACC0NS94_RHOML|nr:hypothetical protein RHMOL_Rhmol05G0168200 [Rhododendron molle]KAI8555353.1 hypothetical protein RHMOL_Rhmol05G0168200 [Rhododendron molle]KAI8555354.1 hypothetical protein RHMOL_Rhmol05G0168200 [Rhododendron molle]
MNGGSIFSCATSYRVTSQVTLSDFKEVQEEEKSQMVGNVFNSVASNYDLMNDVMSVELHHLWKDRLVSKLNPFPGMRHLDVAGGIGLEDLQSLRWVEGDAEALCFEDASMDSYTIAFGIRNVTHIEKVLAETYRVLKPGGRFLCLELSHVEAPGFKQLYDYYSFSVIPALGELVAGDRESYQYVVESICCFSPQGEDKPAGHHLPSSLKCTVHKSMINKLAPTSSATFTSSHVDDLSHLKRCSLCVLNRLCKIPEYPTRPEGFRAVSNRCFGRDMFASMIADAGFQKVEYESLVGGVVAIHSGLKF